MGPLTLLTSTSLLLLICGRLLMLASAFPSSPLLLTSGLCPDPPGQLLIITIFIPYLLLLGLLVRCFFLEGAATGLKHMVTIEVRPGAPRLLPPSERL